MNEISPYSNSYGIDYEDGDLSLERVTTSYLPSDNDVVHTVLPGETIFSIANRYYGNSGLWSIITDHNNINNPLDEITEGLQLTIPNGRR